MITKLLFKNNLLTNKQLFTIVYGYKPKRNVFDKTSFIENFVPNPTPYNRKPKLDEWSDPSVMFPVVLPRPTKFQGKQLI